MHPADTIVALATAPSGGARAIVRLSGPEVRQALDRCFLPTDAAGRLSDVSRPTAVAGCFRLPPPATALLPVDLYYWPTARSYTRQPAAELHLVGSPPLVQLVIRTLCSAGARLAEPGEFTLRAFLAGRIDLTQAEAVLGVIEAENAQALGTALAQLAGGLARPLSALRGELLNLLADLEAGLDFVEEDIAFVTADQLHARMADAADKVAAVTAQLAGRETPAGLPRVAVIGRPNVGKSRLVNALAGRTAAIVADGPGTTRDFLEAIVCLSPNRGSCDPRCTLVDTAGIERAPASGGPAAAAQNLAEAEALAADWRLLCLDGTRPADEWERSQLAAADPRLLVVQTKCDLAQVELAGVLPIIATSAATGLGLDALRAELARRLAAGIHGTSSAVAATAARCHDCLRRAGESLAAGLELVESSAGDELVAAELRRALDELGVVVGAIYTDDLLDRVFSRFCIGK